MYYDNNDGNQQYTMQTNIKQCWSTCNSWNKEKGKEELHV